MYSIHPPSNPRRTLGSAFVAASFAIAAIAPAAVATESGSAAPDAPVAVVLGITTPVGRPPQEQRLRGTLRDFEVAVAARTAAQTPASDDRLHAVALHLWDAAEIHAEAVRELTGASERRRFLRELKEYEIYGERLVRVADDQRALAAEYSAQCRIMATRTAEAIDDALMLFGHVFTRKSMSELKLQFERLEERAARIPAVQGLELDDALTALADGEAAVAATLDSDARGLARSQGKRWVAQMHGDLAALSDSRAKLHAIDDGRRELTSRFGELRSKLSRWPIISVVRTAEPAAAPAATQPPVEAEVDQSGEQTTAESGLVHEPASTPTERPVVQSVDAGNRRFIAPAVLLIGVLGAIAWQLRARSRRRIALPAAANRVDRVEFHAPSPALDRSSARTTPLEPAQCDTDHDRASERAADAARLRVDSVRGIAAGPVLLSDDGASGDLELVFRPELNPRTFAVESLDAVVARASRDADSAAARITFIAQNDRSDIDDWRLEASVEAAARLRRTWPQARITTHVSRTQFVDPHCVSRLMSLLDRYAVPNGCIEIGLTESALSDGPSSMDTLSQLRALGVRIALVDFGVGCLSMESLQDLPLTRVRLHRSLMDAWDAGDHAGIIARRIAHFAANLGFSAPFDGVEGMTHALREAGSCMLRHSVVLDQRDGCAAGAGSPEAGGMAYESCVCLDDSLILRDVSRQSTEPDVDLAVSRRSAVAR